MFKIQVVQGFQDSEVLRIKLIGERANVILSSPAFKEAFFKAPPLARTRLSKDEAYTILKNTSIDVFVRAYRSWNPWTSSVAYSEGKSIFLNLRRYGGLDDEDLSALFAHEHTHLRPIGFTHPWSDTPDRDQTLPYLIGDLVLKLYPQFVPEDKSSG